MKISIEEIGAAVEEEIIIRCHQVDQEILELCRKIKKNQNFISAVYKEEIYKLPVREILYFETVDNKAFFYCADRVYETRLKLYEFEEMSEGTSFFRASKSVILNADKIRCVKPALNGIFEATLENDEKVMISRQYVTDLKKAFGIK